MQSGNHAKNYRIERLSDSEVVCRAVPAGGARFPPYLIRHVRVHSPSGFETGYGGSGPADLALSILADWLGESPSACRSARSGAYAHHQAFKSYFLAGLCLAPGDSATIPGPAIAEFLKIEAPTCGALAFPPASRAEPPAPEHNDLG